MPNPMVQHLQLLRLLYDRGHAETGDVLEWTGWTRSNTVNRIRQVLEKGWASKEQGRGNKYVYRITPEGTQVLLSPEAGDFQPSPVDLNEGPGAHTSEPLVDGIWTQQSGTPALNPTTRAEKVKRLAELEERRAELAEEIRALVQELYDEGNTP